MKIQAGRKTALGFILIFVFSSLFASAANNLARAENTIWTVDDDSPEAGFSSIQAAIDAATIGDTIYVRTGYYYEHVVVNKQVKLMGENKTSIIDGNSTGDVVTVSANNVEISGFTIQNSGRRIVTGVLPPLGPSGFPVYEGMCGVYLYGCTGSNISGNIIVNNFAGLNIESASNVIVSKNQIMSNCGDCGIRVAFSSSVTLSGNEISHNPTTGAVIFQCTSSAITENQIIDNPSSGIVISFSSRFITVSKNNITNNGAHGLNLVNAIENNVFGNNMSGNYWGVCLSGSTSNKVHENYIQANYYGLAFYDSSSTQAFNNELVNNTNDIYNFVSNIPDTSEPIFPAPSPSPSPPPTTSPNSYITIKILSPASGLHQKGLNEATKDIPLRFTVNEPVSWMAYSLDNRANVTLSGNTTLTRLIEGSHSLVVYVKDADGNSYSSDWVYFKVASTPSVSINSPKNATTYATNNILVNISAVAPIGGVEFIEFWLEGTNYSGVINGVQPSDRELEGIEMFSGLPNGNYTLIAVAHAWFSGAVGSSAVYFTVDSPQTSSSPSPSLSPSEPPTSPSNQPMVYFSSQDNPVLSMGLSTKEGGFQKTLVFVIAVVYAGLFVYFKKRKHS
jgi:nitrous oxidase accessory protein